MKEMCGWKGKGFINFSCLWLGCEQLRIHPVSTDLDAASIISPWRCPPAMGNTLGWEWEQAAECL